MQQSLHDEIPTYLSSAIWVTVLCFPFTGSLAIVEAARTRTALEAGDFETARHCSRRARRWVQVSIVCGILLICATIAVGALLAWWVHAHVGQIFDAELS